MIAEFERVGVSRSRKYRTETSTCLLFYVLPLTFYLASGLLIGLIFCFTFFILACLLFCILSRLLSHPLPFLFPCLLFILSCPLPFFLALPLGLTCLIASCTPTTSSCATHLYFCFVSICVSFFCLLP